MDSYRNWGESAQVDLGGRSHRRWTGVKLDLGPPLAYPWPLTTLHSPPCPPTPRHSQPAYQASPPSSHPYSPSLLSHVTSTSKFPANTGSSPPASLNHTLNSNNSSTNSSMQVDRIDWFGARIGLIRGLKGSIRSDGPRWSSSGARSMWMRRVEATRR